MKKNNNIVKNAAGSRRNWLTAIGLGSFGFAMIKVLPFSKANLIHKYNDIENDIIIKPHPMSVSRNNRGKS